MNIHFSGVLLKKRMIKNDNFGSPIAKFYQPQLLGMDDGCSEIIVILCHTSKRHLQRIYIMYFLILK